jgi:DNA-binding GntR family transcriptional regulator
VSRRFWFYHLGEGGMFTATAGLHLEIIRAIAAGDPEAAADASDRLIDHLVQFTRQTLPGS